jgi:DNA polymerase elongation subunit (family B)
MSGSIVHKKEFYGFTNNEFFKYGMFAFDNQSSYYNCLNLFKEMMNERLGIEKPNAKKNKRLGWIMSRYSYDFKLYETKVTSLLRFFHEMNVDPTGWFKIEKGKYDREKRMTRAQIEIEASYQVIQKVEKNDIARLLVASFDIECCSQDGSFPKFSREEDPIIQIGTSIYVFGDNACNYKYIATLKQCDPIEGAVIECFDNEKDLILGWAKFIQRVDPDIMTGYNIWGFDWEYIYKRCKFGYGNGGKDYFSQVSSYFQRIEKEDRQEVELTIQDLSSSALGVNIYKYIDIEGIVQIDLLKVVQNGHKLDSYKLDDVAKVFMKMQKEDLKPHQIFSYYREGTSDKIQEIAVYCIQDCVLVNELINKLQVITSNVGMSNVCIVPFSYLFLRGQGIKIFSLVSKFCRDEEFLIKDLRETDIDRNSYEGAKVFEPEPGVYFEPVVVMDYNSLYPSSMIAENISHDSILGYREYRFKKKEVDSSPRKMIDWVNTMKSTAKKEVTLEYELVKDTVAHAYDHLEQYNYIDIQYDIFEEDELEKKKVGYKICRYAESKNGEKAVLPRILRKLLKARKDTRKIMEYKTVVCKDGRVVTGLYKEKEERVEIAHLVEPTVTLPKEDVINVYDTHNDFQINVLDGLQLAYKVTCNSLYGQVGTSTSPSVTKSWPPVPPPWGETWLSMHVI